MINKVQIVGKNYLVNDTYIVAKVDGNYHYEEIKKWLNDGNTPIPEDINIAKEREIVVLRTERDLRLKELDRPFWLSTLTDDQKNVLNTYYRSLLDATKTGSLPDRPSFMENK